MPDSVEIREVFKIAAGLTRADSPDEITGADSLEDIFLNAMEQTGAADGRI